MVQQEHEETQGQQGKERDFASFKFVISITALCWEAQEQGILVALELPEHITNSKFCQANEVP